MAKKRGGLGRGLESLFEDTAPSFESDNRIETLPLREIEPDPAQPRKTFDEETLAELAASISEHGLLQPIAVRPHGVDRYLIVAGERRWRACRMAGLTEAPVIVKDVTDEQAMELALVENLQREDLDPVEEALGIRELMTRCDLTQEQAARKLGKSRSALANSLRLLNLPETVLILTQDFPRFFRYSMGSRMVDLTLDMLSLIYKANSSYEKVGVLTEFLDRYRMLQMLFRVCVEQKVITERKYASFGLLLEKIGKQSTSWKQYNERGMKKQEDKRQ